MLEGGYQAVHSDEDVAGIGKMGGQALDIARSYQKNANVTVSVSSHVPKPHTPFQWCAMDTMGEIERKQELLWKQAREHGFKFRKHDMRVSHLEGIVGRGDRRTADLIESVWRKGARFDAWDEHLNWDAWQEALDEWEREHNLDRHQFLSTLAVDGRLPWDHIDVGLVDGFLLKEYRKSMINRLSPPCGKPFRAKVHHTNLEEARAEKKRLICYDCGVACDMTLMKQERINFLEMLGAEKRPERRTEPTAHEAAHKRFARGLSPRVFDRGDNAPYRLRYTKMGQVALQGQLDVVRMLPRIFRRADIELCYSEGFHPKPVISYGPALALGVSSIAELAEVRLSRVMPADDLLERLLEVAPEGLQILALRQLASGEKKLSKCLDAQDILITVPDAVLEALGGEPVAAVQERIDRFWSQSSVIVTRTQKGREKRVEIRASLLGLDVVTHDKFPERLQLRNQVGVRLRLPLNYGAAVAKPSEIARALFDTDISHADMVRTALWRYGADGILVDAMDALGVEGPKCEKDFAPGNEVHGNATHVAG
jgi:radical SAM-linked protein